MTPGAIFDVVGAVGTSLKTRGLIGADGKFATHPPIIAAEDLAAVSSDVEATLKAKGLHVPPRVDKIIQASPMIVSLIATILGP